VSLENRTVIRIPILRPGVQESFPPVARALAEPNGLLAAGGDLSAGRLLDAYRHGIFPWYSQGEPILWWSPDPRMVFATDKIHISARLRRWLKGCSWSIHADTAFPDVVRACAAPRSGRDGTWITPAMFDAYVCLHALGHAHSVEVRDADQALIGGIYGVAIGRMFFGESMFSRASNGSKVALIALCRALRDWGYPLLDAQVSSPHLATLGAYELRRVSFVAHVEHATREPGRSGSWRGCWPVAGARGLL
jgi:leucyl/phenylalanyl-tRNA--protein transferase